MNTQKVRYNEDKINLGTATIRNEDHTLGNIVRMALLRDKAVKFAGYRRPHPLVDEIEIKAQTTDEKKPSKAIEDSCDDLIQHVDSIEMKFRNAMMRYKGESGHN